MSALKVANFLADYTSLVWVLSAFAMGYRLRHPVIRRLFYELRPFYLPAVAVHYVLDSIQTGGPVGWWRIFVLICSVANYFFWRNPKDGDDDRWKRRREKLAETVERRGAKLVVVPAGSGS